MMQTNEPKLLYWHQPGLFRGYADDGFSKLSHQTLKKILRSFPFKVPEHLLASHAGIRKQFWPVIEELEEKKGYTIDPLQEYDCQPVPHLLHKYYGRVLLLVSDCCPVHCRFCFRRHHTVHVPQSLAEWDEALDYIAIHQEISEVIFSGGDPLMLQDFYLFALMQRILKIPHIRRIRWHTRVPFLLPQRLDDHFFDRLAKAHIPLICVLHVNHWAEISSEAVQVIQRFRQLSIPLLSQSVLLHGINDTEDVLYTLFDRLTALDIFPYYLHLADPVSATAHFHVKKRRARALLKDLRHRLPGYAVPRLVKEYAHERSKRQL
ncbi:KamA family radical SAM protein [Magnetococcales bacterium HHB-1]